MQKLIRQVDEKKGIVQVTVGDERWYFKESKESKTGNPIMRAVPSVTWIAGHYPKGVQFYKWLAEKGWDESQAIKVAAGDKGSKVHEAISSIFRGEEVRIDSKFVNRSKSDAENTVVEELTFEEIECILSFLNWKKETEEDYTIQSLAWDMTVFSESEEYAGTIDWIALLTPKEGGKNPLKLAGPTPFLTDFKTSQYIWTEYELQISAYGRTVSNGENPIMELNENGTMSGKLMDVSGLRLAILQLGYRKNKNRYKFTELEDQFDLFQVAKEIWKRETSGQSPRQVDIPIVLSPATTVEEALEKTEVITETL